MKKILKEKLIRKEETSFDCKTLFRNLGQGVIVVDQKGKIIKANSSAEKILKQKLKDIFGKDWLKVLKPEKMNEYAFLDEAKKINLKSAIKRKLVTKFFSLEKKSGEKFPALLSLNPIKNEGAAILFDDNSKEHEVMQTKNELISLAAHQMRTPLTALRWYLEMLIDGSVGKVNAEALDFLQEAAKVNKEMMELIESLLNISRFELGTFVTQPRKLDVTKSADFILQELEPQIKEKNLKILKKYSEVGREIEVDKRLLEIIFQNLLSNAVKYTPDSGEINLKIDFFEKGKIFYKQQISKDSLAVEVSDSGLGIPKKDQKKIFSRLFRAENVVENGFEGTGLGLYIVKSIVDHFGGEINFISKENKGTNFYLFIPLKNLSKSTSKPKN